MQRQSDVDDDLPSHGPRPTPPTASSVRRSLSRTLAVSSGIVTGIVKRLSSTATTLMSSSASSAGPEWREEGDWNAASVESSSSGRSARQKDDPDRSADVDRASCSGGAAAAYRTVVARSGEGKTFGDASSTSSPSIYRREAVVASENVNLTVSKSTLLRPTPNKISQLLPQFRKETSCTPKSHSESVASPLNYILPPYISPFSGRIGDMPAVRLSPRMSPRPLKTEDRARPVTVKISQPDPLKTPFQRCRSIGDPEQNRSNSYCRTSSVETVVEALRKRKHSGIEIQEFDVDDGIETRILEDIQQPLKKRCSRDSPLTRTESLYSDSATTESAETILSRGMKRPALHGDLDVSLQTDSPPMSASAAFKKACQKSSPVQSPLRRYACGAKNLIDASYTSIQRFEKRLRSEDSRQSSILHDRSMLSSGSRMTSRQTSPASSRVSWNASQVTRDDLGSPAVPSSGPSSRCASPSTALDKSQEPAFGLSQRLLVKDGSRKNRLTMLNPSSAAETKLDSEEAQANAVLFTADDLERDRLLLSNRANWMLSEVGLADTTSDVTSQKASTDVVVASAIPSEVVKQSVPSIASNTSSMMTSVGLFGQNMTTSKAVDTLSNPHVTGKDAVVESCVLKSSSTNVPLSDVLTSSTCSSVTSNNSDKSSLAISSSVGILVPSDQLVSTTCTNLPSNSSELLKSSVVDFTGASTKLGGGDGLSDILGTHFQVSQSSLGSFVSVATVSNLTTSSLPLVSSNSDSSTSMTFTFSKNFASSSITSAVGSITTQKTFSSDSTKDPLTAPSVVFGTPHSSLSVSKNDIMTAGATEHTVSASTIANAKSEKVGLEFANKITDLTPGSISAGASVASMSVSSSSLQTVPSGIFAFGNSGAAQTTGIKFGSLATTPTTARDSFGANSGVSNNTLGVRLGSTPVKQNVASGGFAFGDSGSAAATAQSAFSSGGFVFGSSAASQTDTSEKAQNASNCAFPFANSNIIGTSANRLGNSAPIQSTAGGGGFAFGSSTTTQSSCFEQLGMVQATLANSSGFGFSGTTQFIGSNNIFGNSTVTQSSGGFSVEKSVTSQAANSGFVFGTSATIQANGSLPGNAVNPSANNSGLSTSMNTKLPAISFSKSGNAKLQGSGLASSSNTGTFVFGNSGAPSTATSHANTNFGGLNLVNAVGGNVMPNNTFGTSQASSVSFSNSFASVNVNNLVNSTSFGSGFSAVSPFGANLGSSTTFGTNLSSSTAFGTNPSKGDQFSSVTSNPFGNKPFVGNPNVANSMGSVNQSAVMPTFDASGASGGKQFPQLFSGDGFTADQPAPVFNFMGTKSGSVPVSSSGNFVFGKTANPFPTFSQNTGGFAFNHSSGNNNLPSSSNQGFNFPVAVQPAVNSQPSTREFNFSAFGQMQNIATNGIPGPVPFGASGAMTPSFSLGMSTPTARANRGRKKAGR